MDLFQFSSQIGFGSITCIRPQGLFSVIIYLLDSLSSICSLSLSVDGQNGRWLHACLRAQQIATFETPPQMYFATFWGLFWGVPLLGSGKFFRQRKFFGENGCVRAFSPRRPDKKYSEEFFPFQKLVVLMFTPSRLSWLWIVLPLAVLCFASRKAPAGWQKNMCIYVCLCMGCPHGSFCSSLCRFFLIAV